MRALRFISETVAVLVLLGSLAVAFVATLVIAPRYFSTYNSIAVQAAYSQLQGYQTTASLTRTDNRLIVMIYNSGDAIVKVNYVVVCDDEILGGEKDVVILPGKIHYSTYDSMFTSMCYLLVEEPGLLVYKVLES